MVEMEKKIPRLSSLPDTVLLEILSFLDMKHAVQTTILSKRWRDLWTSLGNLRFDSGLFYSPTTKGFDGFQNFVDQVVSASPDLSKSRPTKLSYLACLRLKTWLSVDTIRTIAYLLKISPNIKSLFLEISQVDSQDKEDYLEAEMPFQCILDKLEIVEIQGALGCANELNFLEVLLKNAKVLKKLVVCTSTEPSPDRQKQSRKFFEKLLTFPRTSSNISTFFH